MAVESLNTRSPDSDFFLIQSMAAGNGQALDELYARYGPGIFSYLMARLGERTLAEEVLQDVMLAAWRSASQFRGDSKVLTWLLAIAHHRAINAIRRHTPPLVSLNDMAELQTNDTGPLERIERQSEYGALRSMLDKLPAEQREVLVLVFYHQLSEAEAAAVLGIAAGTVKSRLHRGKEALRRIMHSEAHV
jgi:RNA polymerase sigma factor (sigma-70 family)